MLVITIDAVEEYDEETETFYDVPGSTIELEHSLASISKWEQKYEKPFLSNETKTVDETIDYIMAMNLGPDFSDQILRELTKDKYIDKVNQYLNTKQSATWFNEDQTTKPGQSREIVTSEVIYYWMVTMNVPFECQYWYFNRLLTLIKVINTKNAPSKKVGRREAAQRQRQLNEARLRQYNTRG